MTLSASTSMTGGSFNWYGTITDSTPLMTTTDFTTETLLKSRKYYVAFISSGGCEGDRVEVAANITNFNPTLLAPTDFPTICAGGSHTLTASGAPAGSTYQWFSSNDDGAAPIFAGDKFTTGALTGSLNYYLSATNLDGCTSSRAAVVASVDVTDPIASFSSSQGLICQNDATLVALSKKDPANTTYRWYEAAAGGTMITEGLQLQTEVIENDKSYFISAVNANGCEGTSRSEVLVKVNKLKEPAIDASSAGTLKSNSLNGNQWYFEDQPLAGEDKPTLAVKDPGNYNLKVTSNGCTDWATSVYNVTIVTGLDEEERLIAVYPNPTSEKLTIHVYGADPVRGQLYDEKGASAMFIELTYDGQGWTGELDVRSFSKGLYLLRLFSDTKSVTHKVIIK